MSTKKGRETSFLKKVVASACSLALAVAFVPVTAVAAFAEDETPTAAFTISVKNELTGQVTVAKSYTTDQLQEMAKANTTELTYAYSKSGSTTTYTTSSYVSLASMLDGVEHWDASATVNADGRAKGDPWTYSQVTGKLYYETVEAPAVLALSAEKDGEAFDGTPMTCFGTVDGATAPGNVFWTGVTGLTVSYDPGFTVQTKNVYTGETAVAKTYTAAELKELAAKNTAELTYAYSKNGSTTTYTTSSYVKLADLVSGISGWDKNATLNVTDRTKGDPWTYSQVTGKLYYETAEAPAVLALSAEKNGEAFDGTPMTCLGTADGATAPGNVFWTGASGLVITYDPGFKIYIKNAATGSSAAYKTFTYEQIKELAAKNTEARTYAYTKGDATNTYTTSNYVLLSDLVAGVPGWDESATLNVTDRTKGDPWTYEQITGKLYYEQVEAPAVLALSAEKNGEAFGGTPMTCLGTADGATAPGNVFWTGSTSLTVTYAATLAASDVAVAASKLAYDGTAKKPAVSASYKGKALEPDVDYTVAYANNTNAGTATATITGIGKYKGTVEKTFAIGKADQTVTSKNVTKTYKGKATTAKGVLKASKTFKLSGSAKTAVSFTKASGNKKITVSKNGKVTVKKGLKKGTYKVKVTVSAAAGANYNVAAKTITITVKVAK